MEAIKHFENYVRMGFQVIPLWPNTKIPIGKKWNVEWSEKGARSLFNLHPKANLGILLGSVVDVEGDTEEANKIIQDLIGDYPHPFYKGSKSIHHLFQNPDAGLTRISRNDIEFRAYKHQSAIPPSIHPDGSRYEWLTDNFIIPPMPDDLLALYGEFQETTTKKRTPPKKRPDLIVIKCPLCGKRIKMNRKRYRREYLVFREKGEEWCCSNCRTFDIRPFCRELKKRLRFNR